MKRFCTCFCFRAFLVDSHQGHKPPPQRHESLTTLRVACDAASQLVAVWFWATLIGTFYCAIQIVLPVLCSMFLPIIHPIFFICSPFCFLLVLVLSADVQYFLVVEVPRSSSGPLWPRLTRPVLTPYHRRRHPPRNSHQLALRTVREVIVPTGSRS